MIYLIDDKKLRQENDYEWSKDRFEKYGGVISTIYTLDELTHNRKKIFKEGNVVLYHESFLDLTPLRDEAIDRRRGIEDTAKSKNFSVVFFSGSKNSRDLKDNIANIPVSVLYNNLDTFLEKYRGDDFNLNYLLFGENFKVEEYLQNKITDAVDFSHTLTSLEIDNTYLHIRPAFNSVKNLFTKAKEQVIFNNVTDDDFSLFILSNLNEEQYKTIFLPISLGSVLSDFNGLRLATHIRCSSTLNKLTPIVIYSNIDLSYLLGNEYFNILNTKNIFFVNYMIDSFDQNIKPFKIEDLPSEMAKLKLEVPKDYYDNHSIANEWGIYRWANTLNYSNENIDNLVRKIDNNLYFKYLKSVYPITDNDKINAEDLKINSSNNLRFLYIDDEVFKGWNDVFEYIFKTKNRHTYDFLDCNFNNLNRQEINDKALERIKTFNPDIVLLDFRLHSSDFNERNIKNVTGLQVLRSIKAFNPGIQVIILSATNKIWNYQEMLDCGVDGFIIKESIGDNFESNSTSKIIKKLINKINYLEKRTFLKNIWLEFVNLKHIDSTYQIDIDISWKLLYDSITAEKYFNYAYLQLFLIIEKFINTTEVFEKNDKARSYVKVEDSEVLVFDFKSSINNQPTYKSAIKFKNGNYKIERDNNFIRRLDTNAIVSSLLLFRYGCEKSNVYQWKKIYQVRNKKAAHPDKEIVTIDELVILIEFLNFIFDNSNINTINFSKGLNTIS